MYMARANEYTAGGSAPQPDKDQTARPGLAQGYYIPCTQPSTTLLYASTNRIQIARTRDRVYVATTLSK